MSLGRAMMTPMPQSLPRSRRARGAFRGGAGASSLETDLRKAIAASKAEIAVAMRTLDGRDEVLIDPDGVFHAASTMKVPVMIELFRQARAGTLDARRSAAHPQRSSTASSTAAPTR